MITGKPYPMQRVMMDDVKDRWSRGLASYLCCGQRSGKTMLLGFLSAEMQRPLYIRTVSRERELRICSDLRQAFDIGVYPYPKGKTIRLGIIAFDDPEHCDDSLGEWRRLVDVDHNIIRPARLVIAVGSPWDLNSEWREIVTHRHPTWEVNPNISRANLQEEYDKNFEAAHRDFGVHRGE